MRKQEEDLIHYEDDEQEGNSTKQVLVLWMLKDRLGDLAPLVTQYLVNLSPKLEEATCQSTTLLRPV